MKRYVVLSAALFIQVCLGGLYAWSEFIPKLKLEYSISTTQTQIIFGTTIAMFTIAMLLAGRLQDKKGPMFVAFIGGILFGAGYLISAFSNGNFYILILGVGIVSGTGIAFGYVAPLATCVKWFPNHKGLVTGISVAGFGGGAILLAELVEFCFVMGLHINDVFLWIGVVYGTVIIASSLFLSIPPDYILPVKKNLINLHTLTRDRKFWRMVLGMFAGTFAGLLVIGNLKPLGLSVGLSSTVATAGISLFALGNAAGRIFWGNFYDKIGNTTVPLSLLWITLSVGALLFLGENNIIFLLLSLFIGMGFGSCFVLYATSASHIYGANILGSVYPWIFLAYGFSGIMGPITGGWLFDSTGAYAPAIILATCLTAIGALGCHLLQKKNQTC